MIERQCEGWPAFYFVQGPFGLKIWSDTEPVKGTTISFTIGAWEDRAPMTIWMDGRPHPSAVCRAHARRLHDRPLGGRHARRLHHAHEGRLPPEERPAEQRPGDDDVALLPSWRHPDRAGGDRRSDLPGRAAYRDEELSARRRRRSRRSVRRACPDSKGGAPGESVPHYRAGEESVRRRADEAVSHAEGSGARARRKRCIRSTGRKSRRPTCRPRRARPTAEPHRLGNVGLQATGSGKNTGTVHPCRNVASSRPRCPPLDPTRPLPPATTRPCAGHVFRVSARCSVPPTSSLFTERARSVERPAPIARNWRMRCTGTSTV